MGPASRWLEANTGSRILFHSCGCSQKPEVVGGKIAIRGTDILIWLEMMRGMRAIWLEITRLMLPIVSAQSHKRNQMFGFWLNFSL